MSADYDKTKDALFEGLLSRSFEIEFSDSKSPDVYYEPAMQGLGAVLPLLEEEDRDILLHREAHFASSFALMLEAYENETRAAVLDIDAASIRRLMHIEEKLGKNLAPIILQADDAKKIAQVRKMYKLLRDASGAELGPISDMILSEDEDFEAIAKKTAEFGPFLIPALRTIIENDILYDPLWPGYGQAPCIAAITLGLLQAASSIPSLFSMLQNDSFDVQNASLRALTMMQDESEKFCLAQLKSRPISRNNELAALALCSFTPDDEIINAVNSELQSIDVQKHKNLTAYLEACREGFP